MTAFESRHGCSVLGFCLNKNLRRFIGMTGRQKLYASLIIGTVIAAAAVGGWLIWQYYPAIENQMKPENMAAFQQRLSAFGIWGALVLFAIQTLQVISGIIPALPIQICAGITYGALGGLLLCMAGILAGSALVFAAVKKYGQPLIDRVFPAQKQHKLHFLYSHNRLNHIVFILYLIPAMPKDVLTYIAALTPLTLRRYLILTMIARIPTILGSTFASHAIMEGNYGSAVLVFCISGTLGILCLLFSKQILNWLKKFRKT